MLQEISDRYPKKIADVSTALSCLSPPHSYTAAKSASIIASVMYNSVDGSDVLGAGAVPVLLDLLKRWSEDKKVVSSVCYTFDRITQKASASVKSALLREPGIEQRLRDAAASEFDEGCASIVLQRLGFLSAYDPVRTNFACLCVCITPAHDVNILACFTFCSFRNWRL